MKELAALIRRSWRVVSGAPQLPLLQITQTRFMITRTAFISRRANLRRTCTVSDWYQMRIGKLIIISKIKASARLSTALKWQRRDFLCPVVKIPQMRSNNHRWPLQALLCSSSLTHSQESITRRTHLCIKWVRMYQKMLHSIRMRRKGPPGSKTKTLWLSIQRYNHQH